MKRALAALLVAILLSIPMQALAEGEAGFTETGGDECFWYHPLWLGFGCSQVDLRMMVLKKQAEIYQAENDSYMHWATVQKMVTLQNEYDQMYESGLNPLHVQATTPLSRNSVIDFQMAGANVRYASIPGAWNRPNKRLVIYDKLGRDIKINGAFCTSEAGFWRNVGLTFLTEWFLGEYIIGKAIKVATAGKVVLAEGVTGTGWGALTTIATAKSAMAPGSGDCIMIVDILDNPRWDGSQHVYRNQVRISQDGDIDARQWSDWKYADNGIGFWKDMGPVTYDEYGIPVW